MGRFGNDIACSLMMSMALRVEAACLQTSTKVMLVPGSQWSHQSSACGTLNTEACPGADYFSVAFDDGYNGQLYVFADLQECIVPTPAPTPQAGSMTGDPIVSVNGLKVKFELPSGQTTLMWADDDLEISSKADVITPDKQSQWFSEFILVVNGRHAARIQRKEIKVTSKEMLGTLSTLSLTTVDEAGRSHAVSSPGSYPVGNGTVNIIVKRDGARVGPLQREVVIVNSNSISCSISAERAKKFSPNEEKALKYSHLDIILHKMSRNVKKGLFAEIWGFVPMSSKTARMIKQVTAA